MKAQKITVTIARALAEQAIHQISEARNKAASGSISKAMKSVEVKQMRELQKQRKAISAKLHKLRISTQSKFNVSVYESGDGVNVSRSSRLPLPKIEELKNEIIIANHMNGVPSDKMVEVIVKKHLRS